MLKKYLEQWALVPDGAEIITPNGQLLPVRYQNTPAMLKIALPKDEELSSITMEWWNGEGAARVFKCEGNALLMERAMGRNSLITMAQTPAGDEKASQILCEVAAKLHTPRNSPIPKTLLPLEKWFESLFVINTNEHDILKEASITAKTLFATPQESVILHGDIHHGNVLDFNKRGWLAIDPKHLIGERGFDFANIFCNPDAIDHTFNIATQPGRLARQVTIVAKVANLPPKRLLQWILAYAGLSAAWLLEEKNLRAAKLPLTIATFALNELKKISKSGFKLNI